MNALTKDEPSCNLITTFIKRILQNAMSYLQFYLNKSKIICHKRHAFSSKFLTTPILSFVITNEYAFFKVFSFLHYDLKLHDQIELLFLQH